MNLYLSDDNFQIGGQTYAGFPILVDVEARIVEVALRFFADRLLKHGATWDLKTWKAYGQHLYDYFGFLEAKNLRWDLVPPWNSGDVPALVHYVRWCGASVENCPGYINDKLGTIKRFYKWAKNDAGLIDELPFRELVIPSAGRTAGRLAHTDGRPRRTRTDDVNLREFAPEIRVLTRSQVDVLLSGTTNPTHRVMTYLGLAAGLRAEELASFPADFVIDCSRLPKNVKSVAVRLDPARMETKNSKARTVRISIGCMDALWQYRATVREALLRRGLAQEALFLTRYGVPFVADGFVQPLARLQRQLGFHVHPHMLRHTFATHTLASLEELKHAGKFRGSPLLLVRDLLGHESIAETSRYLKFIHAIDDEYATRYQAEIDATAAAIMKAA